MTTQDPARIPTGWQCPICLHVFSPAVRECRNCPGPQLAAVAPVHDIFQPLPHGHHEQRELLEPRPVFVPADQLAPEGAPR